MRQFAQVRPSFWTGPTGKDLRRLGPEFQLVALYLISAPGANALGLYYLPLPTAAHETGLQIEQVRKILEQFRAIGFCEYDEASEFVFVLNMARFQIGERLKREDKQVPWIWRELEKLRGRPFFAAFLDRYGDAYQVTPHFRREGPSKALRSTETETGDPETEKETETKSGHREGEGVQKGNQVWKQTPSLKVVERENSPPDIETLTAQRRLEARREMNRKASDQTR